jgi:hypothetical protein
MPTTTARVDLVTGITTMMTGYIAANPTYLTRHYPMRPAQFQDLPASYLDVINEAVDHVQGLRYRVFTASVVVVTRLTDNAETAHLHDLIVDSLMDWMTAYGGAHLFPGSSWNTMRVGDEILGDDNQFLATRFELPDITFREGRT